MEELSKDLAELELLEGQATRQRVKNILSVEIRKLQSQISLLHSEIKSPEPLTTNSVPAQPIKKCYEVKLTNYAWDQSSKFVKFYVTLPKVQTVPTENITCEFTEKSLKLAVDNFENKNYTFFINHLLFNINPQESNWKVKNDMVVVNAAKVENTKWGFVTEIEKRTSEANKPKVEPSEDVDPSDGLMSLMKNMYDSGDDEMKRTISKAWYESRNKTPML